MYCKCRYVVLYVYFEVYVKTCVCVYCDGSHLEMFSFHSLHSEGITCRKLLNFLIQYNLLIVEHVFES